MNRKYQFLHVLLSSLVVLSLSLGAGAAQEQARLEASDGQAGDEFGCAVSVSGEWAIVGACFEDDEAEDAGAAYFFYSNGTNWMEVEKVTASDGEADDRFAYSVAIEGNYAVIGAIYDDGSTGAAYIFHYDGDFWSQQAKLTASDAATTDLFGWSVAISGDRVAIGAPNEDEGDINAGAVYVFKRSGTSWTQQAKLTSNDPGYEDLFGGSVSMDGNYIVVGCANNDDAGFSSGSAYVFYYNGSGWSQQAKVVAYDGAEYDYFGRSVAISGDWFVVGSPGDADFGGYSGSAYVFARSGSIWTNMGKLNASDASLGGSFGNAVDMYGDLMIIGASGDRAAYAFEWDGDDWVEKARLADASGKNDDYYGYSVAVGSDYALVGAYGVDNYWGDEDLVGAVYVYDNLSLYIAPIYRFWAPVNQRHFYTINQAERDKLINKHAATWTYEDVAFYTFQTDIIPGTSPIYRFWSSRLFSHFYTMNEAEKDKLIAQYDYTWTYEGPVFYAYAEGQQPPDSRPVYRFWSEPNRTHFYTISESEKDKLISQYSHVYTFEGVAWYAYEP